MIYDNDFFEKILEASHDEIFVCDKDGYMVYCNKAFESNYGINRHEMIGKTAMFLNEAGYSNQTPIPYVVKHGKKSIYGAKNYNWKITYNNCNACI